MAAVDSGQRSPCGGRAVSRTLFERGMSKVIFRFWVCHTFVIYLKSYSYTLCNYIWSSPGTPRDGDGLEDDAHEGVVA